MEPSQHKVTPPQGPPKVRSKNRQKRLCLLVVTLFVFGVLIISSFTVALFILNHFEVKESKRVDKSERSASELWELRWRNIVVRELSSAKMMKAFVIGNIAPCRAADQIEQPLLNDNLFPRFENVGILVNTLMRLPFQIISAPGGIVRQTLPKDDSMYGFDILNCDESHNAHRWVDPDETIGNQADVLIGPYISRIPNAFGLGKYVIHVRAPIYYLPDLCPLSPRERFWGFIYLTLSLDDILGQLNFYDYIKEHDLEYLTYTLNYNGTRIEPIATNLIGPLTQTKLRSFIDSHVLTSVMAGRLDWYLVIASRSRRKYLSTQALGIVLGSILLFYILLLALIILIIFYFTQEYDERRFAPREAPYAVLTLGFCYGDFLWNLAAEQMVQITEKLVSVTAKAKSKTRGCSIPQLQPYANSYIFKNIEDAVDMAFSVMGELQRHPIDQTMERLFGEEGRLLMAYAVHWCVDASVRPSPYKGGGFEYEGPDVVYGGRLWTFAVPNVVTLSEQAKKALEQNKNAICSSIHFFNSVYIRGVKKRQDLYIIENQNLSWVNKSLARAVWQMRYMGQAPQYHARGPGDEINSHSQFPVPSEFPSMKNFSHNGAVYALEVERDATKLRKNGSTCSIVFSNSLSDMSIMSRDVVPKTTRFSLPGHVALNGFKRLDTMPNLRHCVADKSLSSSVEEHFCTLHERRGNPPDALNVDAASQLTAALPRSRSQSQLPVTEIRRESRKRPVNENLQTPTESHSMQSLCENHRVSATSTAHKGAKNAQLGSIKRSKGDGHKTPRKEANSPLEEPLHTFRMTSLEDSSNKSRKKGKSSDTRIPRFSNLEQISTPPQLINVPRNPLVLSEASGRSEVRDEKSENLCSRSPGSSSKRGSPTDCTTRWPGSNGLLQYNMCGPLGVRDLFPESPTPLNPNPEVTPLSSFEYSNIQHPPIPDSLDTALRTAFEQQAIAIEISYDSVRVLMYFFFQGLDLLFHPLMESEKVNIFERLAAALGITQHRTLENFAARCVIQYIQLHERDITLWWDQFLKKQEM